MSAALETNLGKAGGFLRRFRDAPLGHFIGGRQERGASGKTIDNVSPVDGSVLNALICGDERYVDAAARAAQQAFPAWRRKTGDERRTILHRVADLIESRRTLASRLGAHLTLDGGGAAEAIKELTGGRGADVCIEASGASAALNEAVRACAYSARVVALGFFQGEARSLFLGEEFAFGEDSQVFGNGRAGGIEVGCNGPGRHGLGSNQEENGPAGRIRNGLENVSA